MTFFDITRGFVFDFGFAFCGRVDRDFRFVFDAGFTVGFILGFILGFDFAFDGTGLRIFFFAAMDTPLPTLDGGFPTGSVPNTHYAR
jgi:hypothetical protein